MRRRDLLKNALTGACGYTALWRDARAQGTSRVPKLKIREVRAVELRDSGSRYVRVYTDQGLTGTGEMVDNIGSANIINERLGPALVGADPLDIESIYFNFWGWGKVPDSTWPVFMRGTGGGPYLSAVSGIEIALWDLAGKALGAPVYRLLGGKVRDRVAIYLWWSGDAAETRALIQDKHVRGFKMAIDSITERGDPNQKLDPQKRSHFNVTNAEIDEIVEKVGAARDLVGPKVELALECHTRYNTEAAIQIGRAVAPSRPMWLEEPVTSDNLEAMALIRRSVPVPVACGENIYTRYGFLQVAEKQAAAVVQPDMTKCGGLLETRKIASLVELYHIQIAPHGVASPLAGTAYAHVCATVPNFLILEWGHFFRSKLLNSLMRNLPEYDNGMVRIPEAPGIGIEVNDDAIREHLRPGFQWA
ncbi:MAG: D-galactonate dehydratase [Bryobacteraceae bacterium]|nr:D-galactonate dehydratase [Bryobacteraceae bacterium]